MTYSKAQVRRDRIVVYLSQQNVPLTTVEVWEAMPEEYFVTQSGHEGWMQPGYSNVYANLRQLERLGLVTSIRVRDASTVYWEPSQPRRRHHDH